MKWLAFLWYTVYTIKLALFSKVPKIKHTKELKIDILDYPTVTCHFSREPHKYPHKPYTDRN